MPIVLPQLIRGAQVRPWDIAWPLIVLMLAPLALGMLIKFRAPSAATGWPPVLNRISGIAILVYVVIGLGQNMSNIRSLIGTGGILALLLFIIGTMVIGFLLGGRDPRMRSVMGLGTAQRNVATAILVTAQNFSTGKTVSYVLVGAIILLIILLPTARLLGARQAAAPLA
jgi:BASS family bile acid:Na+ symporter